MNEATSGSRAANQYTWTQPICNDCWGERNPDRPATRLILAKHEVCCFCGSTTRSGIYVRIDPRLVPHPSVEKDE